MPRSVFLEPGGNSMPPEIDKQQALLAAEIAGEFQQGSDSQYQRWLEVGAWLKQAATSCCIDPSLSCRRCQSDKSSRGFTRFTPRMKTSRYLATSRRRWMRARNELSCATLGASFAQAS